MQSASTGLREHVWDDDAPNWTDIIDGAYQLLKPLGISQHAWGQACLTLSRQGAAVAVAVIAEKHRRGREEGADEVKSPGGYLRWITRMARQGGIDLGPKLYGLREHPES